LQLLSGMIVTLLRVLRLSRACAARLRSGDLVFITAATGWERPPSAPP